MNKKIKMTIKMDVTIPQGLALQAMFEDWNLHSSIGKSKRISFFCDGDGTFHPNCKIMFNKKMPLLTDKLRKLTIVKNTHQEIVYDSDPITWEISK